MIAIKKKYIINENQDKIAIQLDIKAFEKIEQLLEDYAIAKQIKVNGKEDRLEVNEAKAFYSRLKKNPR